MLNKQTGNMYPFVTHTWNPIRGKCPHGCVYCYMKVFPQQALRLDEKSLKDDLGSGNYIFVGSSTDMWCEDVPERWIIAVLNTSRNFPDNTYLFQSKNPKRFYNRHGTYPITYLIATTIETNRTYPAVMKNAPTPMIRKTAMVNLIARKTVTIEPIMDFDLPVMIEWITEISPEFVSIGADSQRNHLPEPPPDKIRALIEELGKITQVKQKDNLKRLL